MFRKNPDMVKQQKIEDNDERNIAITNKAKARAFDYMAVMYPALMIFFMAREAEVLIWGAMIAAILSSLLVFAYFQRKYHKEM